MKEVGLTSNGRTRISAQEEVLPPLADDVVDDYHNMYINQIPRNVLDWQ